MRRAAIIVLDGLGIGPAPDTDRLRRRRQQHAGQRGPGGRRTSLCRSSSALGLGRCARSTAWRPCPAPRRRSASASRRAPGKDSTTGHWEICGLVARRRRSRPTRTGFPAEVIDGVRAADRARRAGQPAGVGHRGAGRSSARSTSGPASGSSTPRPTASSRWRRTRRRCRSAELYAACAAARELLQGEHGVSRVIARPFVGEPGAWVPHARPEGLQPAAARPDAARPAGGAATCPGSASGKVDDLFAGRGISSIHTATNAEAYRSDRGRARARCDAASCWPTSSSSTRPGAIGTTCRDSTRGLRELDRVPAPAPRGGAGGGPRYLYRRSRQRPDDPVDRSLARGRARCWSRAPGPAGAAGPARAPSPTSARRWPSFSACRRCAAGTSFLSEVWSD